MIAPGADWYDQLANDERDLPQQFVLHLNLLSHLNVIFLSSVLKQFGPVGLNQARTIKWPLAGQLGCFLFAITKPFK